MSVYNVVADVLCRSRCSANGKTLQRRAVEINLEVQVFFFFFFEKITLLSDLSVFM